LKNEGTQQQQEAKKGEETIPLTEEKLGPIQEHSGKPG
jgi:hypothetical protein